MSDDDDDRSAHDERTVQRSVRVPALARLPVPMAPTQKMPEIDERLLAIARGEIDPDDDVVEGDPYGGLIPVDDDGVPISKP